MQEVKLLPGIRGEPTSLANTDRLSGDFRADWIQEKGKCALRRWRGGKFAVHTGREHIVLTRNVSSVCKQRNKNIVAMSRSCGASSCCAQARDVLGCFVFFEVPCRSPQPSKGRFTHSMPFPCHAVR